ncbi:hypothetical protein FB645_005337 [Coemansia sp. IMI 203386]|nr:hypothetical protein FB645_005337 [Coemansia sp. IMI 203386]
MAMALDTQCNVAGIGAEWDNDWHIAALFIIIGTSAVGVFLPIISQTTRGFKGFGVPGFIIQLGQFFGAGVIIATAFIHLFPTANLSLASPCLGTFADRYGAWASLIAMTTVFTMHSIEWWLVETWMGGASGRQRGHGGSGGFKRRLKRCFRLRDNSVYDSDGDDDSDGIDDDDDDDQMLFPAYSRAFNASRMILPQAPSAPANPYVFGGASTMSRSSRFVDAKSASIYLGGFALSKYGNYAAVVQSRQHLAMINNERMSRYLYSEPQFPHYGPPIWPLPPLGSSHRMDVLSMHGNKQAKSTPELLRKYQKSVRKSQGSSGFVVGASCSFSAENTQSSNPVSLRPNSFSNKLGSKITTRMTSKSTHSLAAKQRCLSMPKLPPTTLDAAVCDSLLDPLSKHTGGTSGTSGCRSDNARDRNGRCSVEWSSSSSDSCVSSQNPKHVSGHPVSVAAAAAAAVASRRHSLHTGTVSRKASLGEPYERQGYSTGRLDPVPENGDSWGTSIPYRSADNVLCGLPPLSASLRTQLASGQTTYLSAKTHKRVSIPTPTSSTAMQQPQTRSQGSSSPPPIPPLPLQSPLYQASSDLGNAPSTGRFQRNAVSSEYPMSLRQQRREVNSMSFAAACAQEPLASGSSRPVVDPCAADNGHDESTAIHSSANLSALSKFRLPVEVKRRALATYFLELGIALYSVLIGLALAISDHGFFALFIAICFHQFFEGLALGTSLAELYWIKAQIAATAAAAAAAAATAADHQGLDRAAGEDTLASDTGEPTTGAVADEACVMDVGQSTGRRHNSARSNVGFDQRVDLADSSSENLDSVLESGDYMYGSSNNQYARSKSRRTLTSMATSFTPEPWQVNPQLEQTLGGRMRDYVVVPHPATAAADINGNTTVVSNAVSAADAAARCRELMSMDENRADNNGGKPVVARYLQPRTNPERLPGWWKAWLSALAFTVTTPTGIVIGLAIRHVYEPNSTYALLLNGVLQSICSGVLIYAGLVTLMIGGFNSVQVKSSSRLRQVLLFFSVYSGAAVMAGLKIWK